MARTSIWRRNQISISSRLTQVEITLGATATQMRNYNSRLAEYKTTGMEVSQAR
jgi:hypothetical protein